MYYTNPKVPVSRKSTKKLKEISKKEVLKTVDEFMQSAGNDIDSQYKRAVEALKLKEISELPFPDTALKGLSSYVDKEIKKLKEISEGVYSPENKAVSLPEGIKGKGDLDYKPHLAAIDPYLLMETGLAFRYGQKKHGKDNFRKMTPEAAQELFDALFRHLLAYQAGETHAGDSEVHHLGHVVANCSMLFRLIEKYGDDEVLKVISGGDYGK